jgi:hypothetical protein
MGRPPSRSDVRSAPTYDAGAIDAARWLLCRPLGHDLCHGYVSTPAVIVQPQDPGA